MWVNAHPEVRTYFALASEIARVSIRPNGPTADILHLPASHAYKTSRFTESLQIPALASVMAPYLADPPKSARDTLEDTAAEICHIVTPVGCLGYGLMREQTDDELTRLAQISPSVPRAIILDAGSTDSGPARLALGKTGCPRASYVRDLTKLLYLVQKHRVPLIFSSAGGDGSDKHVDELVQIIQEIIENGDMGRTKVIAVYAGVSKPLVRQRLDEDAIKGYVHFRYR
jgi:hypothetical protein